MRSGRALAVGLTLFLYVPLALLAAGTYGAYVLAGVWGASAAFVAVFALITVWCGLLQWRWQLRAFERVEDVHAMLGMLTRMYMWPDTFGWSDGVLRPKGTIQALRKAHAVAVARERATWDGTQYRLDYWTLSVSVEVYVSVMLVLTLPLFLWSLEEPLSWIWAAVVAGVAGYALFGGPLARMRQAWGLGEAVTADASGLRFEHVHVAWADVARLELAGQQSRDLVLVLRDGTEKTLPGGVFRGTAYLVKARIEHVWRSQG